jgi:NADPH-dependent 2,4-dienoyl-CoA reductase/sulfur reductase-like enzyme/rhodanese-related sulfurtransferase
MANHQQTDGRRIIIIGGVAGGASCAARLRRLDERADILMVERGPYVSYANCGLPYHVGGVIEPEGKLLVATADTFITRFNIDCRVRCEATAIDPAAKTVTLTNHATGEVTIERYDKLVLSPGAAPIRPPLPGIDLAGIFPVRTVPDAREIREWIDRHQARRAVVVGGGFIGLEMAENLVHRGLEVTVVEMLDQVMPPLDREMAGKVAEHLARHGVKLELGDGVAGFQAAAAGGLEVLTQAGKAHAADLVVLAIGVRPETALARAVGLAIGERGGIRVDDQMRSSNPDIFAVGDAVEVKDAVTGQWSLIPLAGPANRQGRIAADVIAGRASRFRGTQGTAVVGVCGLEVASTGASEKALQRAYYPGARMVTLKVLFRKSDGLLLGAQAVGEGGVVSRINALAMALQFGATVFDLEESELCYAPQFGSAKDPVNFAGMVAADVLRGDMPLAHWPVAGEAFLLDVRDADEVAAEPVAGAVNIPLNQLRGRLAELPQEREILVSCRSGQRAYYATRILLQHGLAARNLSGGSLSRTMLLGK